MTSENLINFGKKVIEKTIKSGAEHAEAFIVKGQQLSINLEDSSIVKANNRSLTGIGLRAIINKAVGIASTSQLDQAIVDKVLNDAVSLAKASKPDPDMAGLSIPDKYPEIPGLYDKELGNLESGVLVELAIKALNAALERDEAVNVSGTVNLNIFNRVIVNSNEVEAESKDTTLQIYLNNKITKGDDVGVAFEYAFTRSLKDIDPELIGKTATDKAFNMLGGEKIDSGNYPFLLDERAARNTISGILSQGVSAYNIIQGTAYFSDRLASEIASKALTVYDNPLEPNSFASRKFDDEGTPCQKIKIIENGTLLSYLTDVYTAKKLNVPNTGSASKQGYEGIPHPALRQIQIEPGDKTKDELFAELENGIYLESPLFAMGSTNISQQVDVGYWIEKGEIKHPVKNTMLGTTVYDVMTNIKHVGKDLLVESGFKSPMLLFEPTKFASGR